MARAFGVDVEEISPEEVKSKYEHLNIDGVKAGVWLPKDGQADPGNITQACKKVLVIEELKFLKIHW